LAGSPIVVTTPALPLSVPPEADPSVYTVRDGFMDRVGRFNDLLLIFILVLDARQSWENSEVGVAEPRGVVEICEGLSIDAFVCIWDGG